jgi:DNA-binding CsgD family transcriptional regulator
MPGVFPCRLTTGRVGVAWDGAARALFRRIAPHLERSLQSYRRILRLESERRALAGVLDRIAAAVVLLDERGTVTATNATAARLLASSSELAIRAGRLEARRRSDTLRIARAIERARPSPEAQPSGVITLRSASDERRLSLVVVPPRLPDGAIAVFINDPEQVPLPDGGTLRELYGLTRAESRLAGLLARGLSVQQAAASLSISEHTARNHLKAALAETGTSRQGALVGAVLAAALPVASINDPVGTTVHVGHASL